MWERPWGIRLSAPQVAIPPTRWRRGVALVSVLAILVVLALLAATMAVLVEIETSSASISLNQCRADMLLNSGVEHVRAVLGGAWSGKQSRSDACDVLDRTFGSSRRWFNVHDSRGALCGRYRLVVEDEAGKADINTAAKLGPSPGSGWNPSEINLAQALGMSSQTVQRILDFRYGENRVPGAIGDDDRNNDVLMADRIDNNANGIVDEENEGVDDPGEYNPFRPYGDDRVFSSMGDAVSIVLDPKRFPSMADWHKARQNFIRHATIRSVDMPGSPTLPDTEPADLNCMTARECRHRIDVANETEPFEPIALNRTRLALNMVDYRDENHVLSTMGSVYGVEAICFNEVLANDDKLGVPVKKMAYSDAELSNPDCWGDLKFWKDVCGSVDGQPLALHVSQIYCLSPSGPNYKFDPRAAWHVASSVSSSKPPSGGGSLKFTLPLWPGQSGTKQTSWLNYFTMYNRHPPTIPGLPPWGVKSGTMRYDPTEHCWLSDEYVMVNGPSVYHEIMTMLQKRNKAVGGHPILPANFFKNAYALFYSWGIDNGKAIGAFRVRTSNGREIECDAQDIQGTSFSAALTRAGVTNKDFSVCFDGWNETTANVPDANGYLAMRSRMAMGNRYYKVLVTRERHGYWGSSTFTQLGVSTLDAKQPPASINQKTWACNEPMRTDAKGWLDICLTAPSDTNRKNNRMLQVDRMFMVGPEVVEMYNASDRPISLANWRVICNTGSLATEIGRIKRTAYYDPISQKPLADDNPCVTPHGYFYLVNDTKLFDARFGNGDGNWGSANNEQIPVFQMDEDRWGITYAIDKVKPAPGMLQLGLFDVTLKNEKFGNGMFLREHAQFLAADSRKNDPTSIHGVIVPIEYKSNGSSFRFQIDYVWFSGIPDSHSEDDLPRAGDQMMVMGLPYQGGIVSLTLKDQYEQVCARTVDYGSVEADQVEYSSEKDDPTQPTWYVRKTPSIGGIESLAENQALRNRAVPPANVKDATCCSVGELRRVSAAGEFETVGTTGGTGKRKAAMAALANAFCASAIRLEASGDSVTRSGWAEARDRVVDATIVSVRGAKGGWEPDQWKGHSLRFITGPLRNQSFPVIGNSPNSIFLSDTNAASAPRSAPGRLPLDPAKEDEFTLGPGYTTAPCYARTSNRSGEWLWKRRVPVRGAYYLYIYGLSDAIATTEFLEENNNAPLDVEVFNWATKSFDTLCRGQRYRKEDCIAAGRLLPAQVSADGDLKIRLTAHDVEVLKQDNALGKEVMSTRRSGYAWFNYAMLSPMPVQGRVNVNTASPQLLAALPGIAAPLAADIAAGRDQSGAKRLKPYRGPGGLLAVKGMTPEIFERIANLVSVTSDSFTIDTEVQVLSDADNNGVFDEEAGDKVLAQRRLRYVIARRPGTVSPAFDIAERYQP